MEFRPKLVATPQDLVPYLLPGESVVKVEYLPHTTPLRPPSGLVELYRLAGASVSDKLRKFNPPLASLTLGVEHPISSELRLYEALFGRDSLRVAMDLLSRYPQLTHATLLALASYQGTTTYPAREEEPGRIPHEIRDSQDAIAQELTAKFGWEWPYYGSVDATLEFIRTAFAYQNRSNHSHDFFNETFVNKDGKQRTMADAFKSATEWVLTRLKTNPEGLIESKRAIPQGIENQVWKDSWDAYFHEDGRIANHDLGVASVEVQRLAYDALLDAGYVYDRVLEDPAKAQEVREAATKIQQAIFTHFWTPDKGGFFVLGTDRANDGTLQQLKVRSSNMGHLLRSRLLAGNNPQIVACREAVVRQLFSPEMLTPSGIRTLASDEVRYRPGAYHNGSVWVWDTYFIAKGLRHHGYHLLSELLSQQLLAIVNTTHAFPEFVRGDNVSVTMLNNRIVDLWDETYQRFNRLEQPPQQIQAWSVAAILSLKMHKNTTPQRPALAPTNFENELLQQIKARSTR